MNAHALWKSCETIILALLALGLMTLVAFAGVGTPIPSGSTVTVNAFNICRKVTNPGSGTRMVFTGTKAEWQSFVNHPNGLQMQACPPPCPGSMVGGFCWFFGAAGQSCTTVCAGLGMSADIIGIRDYVGSGGTEANCKAVLDAVEAPGSSVMTLTSCSQGMQAEGCLAVGFPSRLRCINATTTADATDEYGYGMRACACK